jgi:hypothetical protein
MPEEITISVEEYAELLTIKQSDDYVWGIVQHVAHSSHSAPEVEQFALKLLDEWTK